MTKFRACIDLHKGKVKQIVGSTLSEEATQTNFISKYNSTYYANLYKKHNVKGSHLIQLGPNNEEQAKMAIAAYKDLQVGGGINLKNCQEWIKAGAKQIIVTSCLFKDYKFQLDYLLELNSLVGKEAIVIDLSCKRVGNQWIVAMDKWQKLTDLVLSQSLFDLLSDYCSEFLVHAADVEGKCEGIDEELVIRLGEWCSIPCTYAGGARDISDLDLVNKLSNGKVDLTMGSCLDIFGGKCKFIEAVEWNNK